MCKTSKSIGLDILSSVILDPHEVQVTLPGLFKALHLGHSTCGSFLSILTSTRLVTSCEHLGHFLPYLWVFPTSIAQKANL